MLNEKTAFIFETAAGSGVSIKGQRGVAAPQLFKARDLNFEKLGIGGLDAQFSEIFRRAFQSRVLPPALAERLGVPHVKGMLLFGPPGTGPSPPDHLILAPTVHTNQLNVRRLRLAHERCHESNDYMMMLFRIWRPDAE